jgi:acyl carrier protein
MLLQYPCLQYLGRVTPCSTQHIFCERIGDLIQTRRVENRESMNETQKLLADMWCDLLQIESVELRDRFIEIGGDSVAAMLCVGRVRKALGLELQLEEFFVRDASLENMAARIDQQVAERKAQLTPHF